MKLSSLFFALLFSGFPLSRCAQLPGEAQSENEADKHEQVLHLRSSHPSWASTESGPLHTVSSKSPNEVPLKEGDLLPVPAGELNASELSREGHDNSGSELSGGAVSCADYCHAPQCDRMLSTVSLHADVDERRSGDAHDSAAGEDDFLGEEEKQSVRAWLANLAPAVFQSFFKSEAEVDARPTAAGGAADEKSRGMADALDPTVSVDNDALASAKGRYVPSFLEQIEAAMQPLFAPSLFSALGSFENVLMPAKFSGPEVTFRMDKDRCIYDVDLQHLPDTASLRVGVEGRRVFLEYDESVKRVSRGKETFQKESQDSLDEGALHEEITHQPAASTEQLEDHAQVYFFETFQVSDICDHRGPGGKASRAGRDHLRITFPLKKKNVDDDTLSRPSSSEKVKDSPKVLSSDAGVSPASGATQDSAISLTRRFMKRIKSTGEVVGRGGLSRSKPAQPVNVFPGLNDGRRYIPILWEDAF